MLFKRFLKRRKTDATAPSKTSSPSAARQPTTPPPPLQPRDLDQLASALTSATATDTRDAAARRYGAQLARLESETARQQRLAAITEPAALASLARHCPDAALRLTLIARLDSAPALAECALEDPVAANRRAAIERLETREALEQVVREIGKRDKIVHRRAREKLRLIAEREAEPRRIHDQAVNLCERAERLGRLGNWTQDRALLDHLDQQWAEIGTRAEAELRERYQQARTRFIAAFETATAAAAQAQAEQQEHAARTAAYQSLLTRLETLVGAGHEDAAEVARIDREWEALETLPETEQATFDARRQELRARLADHDDQAQAQARTRARDQLAEHQARIAELVDSPKPLVCHRAERLLERAHDCCATLDGDPATIACKQLADRLATRLRTQRRNAEQRRDRLGDKLAELEQRLEAGELRKADALFQSLQAGLELVEASGCANADSVRTAERLRQLAPQLRELQQWRRWSADQQREALCTEIAALEAEAPPLEQAAAQLQSLQQRWKEVDRSGARADETLRNRFQETAARIRERCRPHLEAEAAERARNRTACEQLCAQLERIIDDTDWTQADWKRLVQTRAETRRAWAAIGPVEPRHRHALERRFHRTLKRLERPLEAERKRNLAFKRSLIAEVEALVGHEPLEEALERTKALQREWHTTVAARQKEENRIWREFRAACDAVFARRAALQKAQFAELEDNLGRREALCAAAEQAAEGTGTTAQLGARLHALEAQWHELQSLPVPRQAAGALNNRWKAARQALVQARQHARDQERGQAIAQLERQEALCARVERAALDTTENPLDRLAIEAEWAALGELREQGLQEAMNARLGRACAALDDGAAAAALAAALERNGERRQQLCLQLEILTGIDSPPEFSQQRLEYQVARLAERMGDGESDPLGGTSELLRDWYLSAPAPIDAALAARFARVVAALTPAPAPHTETPA
ncbi:DUF349 domain-containing protein [Marichromatium bheemlicum]|uniref:DUF349 domain-containing protein n=1 Tax=Marichromatium bheemlicum TaxID=365339 RepID=A0ABX1I2P4_9GAMM|nr:DUF349 domain-containing protein [Marichromatium bheemlicum]NKN31717.1 DUF349 domain-containing protein [Marichromatium bheemlicum]